MERSHPPASTAGAAPPETPTELLGPVEWHTLEQQGLPRSYPRGHVLFSEGDPGGSVTALRRGRTKVSVQTLPGRELLLTVKGPGELVGEMSALDGRPRSATATAMEAVEALVVPASVFHDFLKAHPRIALRLLQTMAAELRDTDELLADRDAGDTLSRTARRLVHLARRYGKHNGRSTHVGLSLTHDELAGWIGVSRESASRALSQLRVDGFITTGRRSITVVDLVGLRRRYLS
ncbi:MAG: Crp/Fnr family transcriptional regulator [Pseudonocardiaceae bacterium]